MPVTGLFFSCRLLTLILTYGLQPTPSTSIGIVKYQDKAYLRPEKPTQNAYSSAILLLYSDRNIPTFSLRPTSRIGDTQQGLGVFLG